jgi:4-amino-4-deoxy-L-arabinose transferase-like glycosyltransferase
VSGALAAPGSRAGSVSPASWGALLFAVAAIPRLFVALLWAGEPVWDGHYYDFGARRIAQGFGYSDSGSGAGVEWHPWCHYPVGYSAFVGFFYRLLGDTPRVVAAVDALTGAALALVTWMLARRALAEGRARAAGLLVALHPGLILYAGLEMSEPLAALTTLGAFWIAVRDPRPLRGVVKGAMVLGVSALVRPQALLCVPFLALVIPKDARAGSASVRRRVVTAALACSVALLPVLPWTARNCRVMDGCALISTNAGWNLAIGAFPRATGRFETLRASDGCREVTGQVQQDRCWFEYGLTEIRSAPGRWLSLMPKKLGFTFDHESFAVEYLHEARPTEWPDDRRALFRGITSTAHRVLVAFAALGICAVSRRRAGVVVQGGLLVVVLGLVYVACSGTPTFWPLVVLTSIVPWLPLPGRAPWPAALKLPVALLGTTVVTHAVFFGEDRYHLVVTPVLCILSAAAFRRESARGT